MRRGGLERRAGMHPHRGIGHAGQAVCVSHQVRGDSGAFCSRGSGFQLSSRLIAAEQCRQCALLNLAGGG
jgi:hypothetical protein